MVAIGNFLFRYRNALFPLTVILLLLPGPDLFDDPLQAAMLGALVAALGQLVRALTIGLDYIVRGGRGGQAYADRLVTGGVFAHCRNPMYLGNLLIITGLAVAADSWVALVVAPALFLFAYHCIIRAEEDYLLAKFDGEYVRYCERTPRLAFRLEGLAGTVRAMPFRWRRLVVKEYGTPVAWITGLALLAIINLLEDPGFEPSRHAIMGLVGIVGVAAALWLFARVLKKTGRLAGD